MRIRIRPTWLGLGLALMTTTGSAFADSPDTWITTKAKIALLTADDVSVTAVNVDTVEGNVTLHGKVKTESEKGRAAAAVSKVDGVKKVQNLLQVVPDAFKDATNVADSSIKDGVAASLKGAPALDDVKVASVNKGVVLLSGKTDGLGHELQAIEVAYKVPGVRRVASEIETSDKGDR
jgi:hyperosmotically inducible periplasmic protein